MFSVYLIISLSFLIIYQTSKFFNLAHGVIITFGAYFTYLFSRQFNLPILLSISLAVLGAALIAVICELFVYKPLRKRSVKSISLLIVSLGVYVILQNIISLIWGDAAKSINPSPIKVGNDMFGAYITNIQIVTIIVSVVLFVSVLLILSNTRVGNLIRAVSSNNELSNIFGINTDHAILWSIVLGSCIAAIGGILVALDTNMSPTFGFNLLLYGIVAMIIGGVGSIKGLIGGSLLLATAQNIGAYYINSQWMNAIAYIILILFLLWKPLGFSGKRLKKVEI